MDKDKLDNDISNVLQEFKDLHTAFDEGKKAQQELAEFVALAREELKLARDAERNAECKKNRSQAYVSQQQEVILKLLNVKEENEHLKRTITQMETTISEIQNSSMANHVKKDTEIQIIKQDYLKELMKVKDAADKQMKQVKADLACTVEDLRLSISKKNETIDQQESTIDSLRSEVKNLTERAAVNVDIYQKKLAEQEKRYQAELDTWKMAELNRNTLALQYPCPSNNLYQPNNLIRREYQTNSTDGNYQTTPHSNIQHSHPAFQNQSVIHHRRNILPSRDSPNVVRPLPITIRKNCQKSADFLSANDFYLQNHNLIDGADENAKKDTTENLTDNNQSSSAQKPKMGPNKKRKLFNTNQNML